jgi:hypothetical protein
LKINTPLLNAGFALAALYIVSASTAFAAENKYGGIVIDSDQLGAKEYSPNLDRGYPQRVFWGDTHLHTSYSTDAGMMANRLGPDFDAKQRAFYYVRVLEIPTPRWTTYDAAFYGVELPKDVPASQQERAYTSPIWYTPEK